VNTSPTSDSRTVGAQAGSGLRAAVIGGSLGGLTVANLLRDAGWDVAVFERSSTPLDGRGAGIVVHDATVEYLVERMGLSLDDISCASTSLRYFAPDGTVVHEEPSTYRFTAWNTLYQNLLQPMADRYRLGHALAGFDQRGDDVELRFANGVVAHADLVVAADGFDSTVRRRLFGPVDPHYSGYVGWRGLVDEARLSPATFELLADAISYCVIPGSHIVAYPIPTFDGSTARGTRLVNYVWYRNVTAGAALDELMTGTDGVARSVSLPGSLVQTRFVDEMKEAACELAAPLAEAIERTPQPFVQVIIDVATPDMAVGRMAVLGDAAFCARPHAAAGTAKAAEDAWRLVEAVSGAERVETALATWSTQRMAVGRALVDRARQIGERSQLHDTWVPGDPSLAFGLHGPGR
jgi:2,6-dihydroxypyridine 3-monooxygenase